MLCIVMWYLTPHAEVQLATQFILKVHLATVGRQQHVRGSVQTIYVCAWHVQLPITALFLQCALNRVKVDGEEVVGNWSVVHGCNK